MDTQLRTHTTILQAAFGATATLAGLDKFFNLLANWPAYVSPAAAELLPVPVDILMRTVGVVELAVGLALLGLAPRLGALAASAWLALIAVNLVVAGYFDVAVRDVVMALSAWALARLIAIRDGSAAFEQAAHRPRVAA